MRRADVQIGGTYLARVSGRIVRVRIERDEGEGMRRPYCWPSGPERSYHRGWGATNEATGRTVHVTSGRLRSADRRAHYDRCPDVACRAMAAKCAARDAHRAAHRDSVSAITEVAS